ncbi:MAG: MFS transporter [Endozoicomonas sp.]
MLAAGQRRLVWVISLGGFLEFYDFIIYALMAGYLADNFFPSDDPWSSLLTTFATFSVGYFARPVGGIVFGHFGDRHGRKPTFITTVLIMALSTALIGCLPTYQQAGILAPVLLILLRIFQGFSIGGEIPGAMTYLSETVHERQGLVMGMLFLALVNGVVFGSLVHACMLWWLTPELMASWGWRVPFWLGGSLGICSYLVRKSFHESSQFLDMTRRKQQSRVPIAALLQDHRKTLLCGIFMIVPVATSMTLLFLFTPGYLTKLLAYDPADVVLAGSIGLFGSSLVFVAVGNLADTCSGRWLLALSSVLVLLLAWPVFAWYSSGTAVVLLAMLVSALMLGAITGIAPLLLSFIFPVSVRYSGIAFSYNLGFALFGGMTPVIAMGLIRWTGDLTSPAWYLMVSGVCGLLACILLPCSRVAEGFQQES